MGEKNKILIVDDEEDIVRALTIRLQSNGCEVVPAFHGEQAVLLAHKENPDLIILDIRMPGGMGFAQQKDSDNPKSPGAFLLFF